MKFEELYQNRNIRVCFLQKTAQNQKQFVAERVLVQYNKDVLFSIFQSSVPRRVFIKGMDKDRRDLPSSESTSQAGFTNGFILAFRASFVRNEIRNRFFKEKVL